MTAKEQYLAEYKQWVWLENPGLAPSPRKYDLWTCDLVKEMAAIRAEHHNAIAPNDDSWYFWEPIAVRRRKEGVIAALASREAALQKESRLIQNAENQVPGLQLPASNFSADRQR